MSKLGVVLEQIPAAVTVRVGIRGSGYPGGACLTLRTNWEKQRQTTGGLLIMEWETLRSRVNQFARGRDTGSKSPLQEPREEIRMNRNSGQIENRAGVMPRVALYTLFFLSGVTALVYEGSWSRLIGLAVGQNAESGALTLAAYFTGMATGQFLGGRIATRFSPLLMYGAAELAAAGWACIVPSLLGWVGTPSGTGEMDLFRHTPGGRAAWSFLILLPATIALGATLPFIVQALRTGPDAVWRGSVAYGLNTAGGLLGIVLATALLMVFVGVRASGYLAAAISAVCGVIACGLAMRFGDHFKPKTQDGIDFVKVRGTWGWAGLAAASGFGILGLEVLYTRLFALVFHNSTYTFGAVVAGFLLALSIGAALASWLGRWIAPRRLATASFSLGGLVLAVSIAAFPRITELGYFKFGETFASYLAGAFGLVALFVLPPVTLLGMALPSTIQAAKGCRSLGMLTATNTLAGAVGALFAGFLLPQWVGLWSAFAVFVTVFAATGTTLLVKNGSRKIAIALVLGTTPMALLIATGSSDQKTDAKGDTLLQRRESAYGWIDVVQTRNGSKAVRQNLHYRHGSTEFSVREYRQGRLPLLLHDKPVEVAYLGLGTGLTAAPAVLDEAVEKAVIIELIPQVIEASRLLSSANFNVVDHPKVDFHVADARHHLLRTEQRFDVIASDLFVPWESRAGYLYTVEFYETVRRRLKPGGLFCQWIALYQLGSEEFELIANSFSSVFPHTTVWWGRFDAKYPIVALVGSEGPLDVGTSRLEHRMDAWNLRPAIADSDLRFPLDLASFYLGEWVHDNSGQLNTDEHPRLEFSAPISHRDGRTLQGPRLKMYYDQVLSKLPSSGVRFGSEFRNVMGNDERRRAVQRLSLFGE